MEQLALKRNNSQDFALLIEQSSLKILRQYPNTS